MQVRMTKRNPQSGQTLIIALLILGVLLGIGLVFAALISRNISQTSRSFQRTRAGDLADAGIRLAHTQLLYSELGADWRPDATPPAIDGLGFTRDPDALYTRPASGFPLRAFTDTVVDRGGPDGLGPFTRVNFDRGRALVRVLYVPGDLGTFAAPSGVLRQPGKARQFVRVEAIGRVGTYNPNDPTRQAARAQKVSNFANDAEFRQELANLRAINSRQIDQKKLIAFVSMGLIEHARFITNKYKVSRAAEFGSLTASTGTEGDGLGISYEGTDVSVPTLLGGTLYDPLGTVLTQGAGSMYINSDVVFHGLTRAVVNPGLGENITVAGRVRAANGASTLELTRVNPNGSTNTFSASGNSLNSNSGAFSTQNGLLRDGVSDIDANGFPRSAVRKEPPTFLGTDPNTGVNRYLFITRDSGALVNGRNVGRFGYGQGVYVSASDRANVSTEAEREQFDPTRSLVKDWLNPNNPNSIAWKGPYYIPVASYVRLLPDGFEIIRDARSSNAFQRTWRRLDGTDSGRSDIRYILRAVPLAGGGTQVYSLNSITNPARFTVPSASVTDATFVNEGSPFNGVLYFEGDVRIRGVIPTDHQLTLASAGSIYIEGSITKGVIAADGTALTRPSRSMLMLMAKDYVTINPTMFFGPRPGTTVAGKTVDPLPNTANPIELVQGQNDRIQLTTEFLLDPNLPNGLPNSSPSTWVPFASSYVDPNGAVITSNLLLSHSADDNGPSFVNLFVKPRTFLSVATITQPYLFDRSPDFNTTAGGEFPPGGNIPVYGLTTPQVNAYPRFEMISVPFVTNTFALVNRQLVAGAGNPFGGLVLGTQDSTELDLGMTTLGLFTTKNYALARAAINPHDVRIEASLFAEEGSFFVIPGGSFNVNSDDTRQQFQADVTSLGLSGAQLKRYQSFGAMPGAPFFGEALNIKVSVIGSVTENMPAPIGQQADWQRKWGWMPRIIPGTDLYAPRQHIPNGWPSITGNNPGAYILPNLTISFDPSLALGSADGSVPIRRSPDGLWTLPPMPRLPVSPKLVYFGEENP